MNISGLYNPVRFGARIRIAQDIMNKVSESSDLNSSADMFKDNTQFAENSEAASSFVTAIGVPITVCLIPSAIIDAESNKKNNKKEGKNIPS